MKKYDVIVIGSGSGIKIIRPAACLGYKVAAIEKTKWGGTCLNRGCIPSKMLIHSADVSTVISDAHRFEIDLSKPPTYRFDELVSRVNQTTDADSELISKNYNSIPNIDAYQGEAKFIEDKIICVNDEILAADKIFIAVGAEPYIPRIAGLQDTPYMTSDDALRRKDKPKKLIIIGAGYIATELGHFYSALGVETHFIVRSRILRHVDSEVQHAFEEEFSKNHHVYFGMVPESVFYKNDEFTLTCLDSNFKKHNFNSDALLVATGIDPCSAKMGLEHTNIETDERGFIQVNNHLETTVPGIWAWGDCIGRYFYRHTANFEGEYVFDQAFEVKKKSPLTYPPVPYAVFTHPQVAGVGKTEDELKKKGIDYLAVRNNYTDSAMGMALRSEYGFVKLLFDRKSRRLLGAHIVGDEAATMIHMVIAYMSLNATLEQMVNTIYIHPALPEVIRNACRKARKLLA